MVHNFQRPSLPNTQSLLSVCSMSSRPRHASSSSGKASLPTGNTTFVAAVFQKSSAAAHSSSPRPAADSAPPSAAPPPANAATDTDEGNLLIRSRSSSSSVGRIVNMDRNIFNVEDAVGGSFDRPKTNAIIKGTFKDLQELREKIRSEFKVASLDEVGDIEIFDEEKNMWQHLVSFDLADRLSRKSIAKLRWCVLVFRLLPTHHVL